MAVVNDDRPSIQEQLQEVVDQGPPELSGADSAYATPPIAAIVADAGVPESVRKAEQLATETKSGATSEDLAPYLKEMDEGAEAALRTQITALFDSGLPVTHIVEQTGLSSNEILQLLTDAGRDVEAMRKSPWLLSRPSIDVSSKDE